MCAATLPELAAFWPPGAADAPGAGQISGFAGGVAFLVTGVGVPCALGRLYPFLREQDFLPRRILNVGIAGAYPGSGLAIGDIVIGDGEVYGDVGMELPDTPHFLPIADTPFGGDFYAAPIPLTVVAPVADDASRGYKVQVARGCTVGACAGTDATGTRRAQRFGAAFETMEGAAVAQAGRDAGIPVTEIRAISNMAARRDMRPENIARALDNLRRFLQVCRAQKVFP